MYRYWPTSWTHHGSGKLRQYIYRPPGSTKEAETYLNLYVCIYICIYVCIYIYIYRHTNSILPCYSPYIFVLCDANTTIYRPPGSTKEAETYLYIYLYMYMCVYIYTDIQIPYYHVTLRIFSYFVMRTLQVLQAETLAAREAHTNLFVQYIYRRN